MKDKFPTTPERERRFISASVELRAAQNTDEAKPTKIFGYAAKFNVESDNMGSDQYQFREIIMPGAFDDVLNDDVRALFNHDSSMILARSKNGEGTLQIGVDETGLYYEFEPPDTQVGRDLITSIQRGDVDQSSFGFMIAPNGDKWEEKGGGEGPTIIMRTITKFARLLDVSPVTFPAYPDASVAIRSLQQFQAATKPEPIENHSLSHWQRRMGLLDKSAANQK